MTTWTIGPLEDSDYIEHLQEEFHEARGRPPYGGDELLRWHRNRVNEILKEFDRRVTADYRLDDSRS
jgi:hypothetical protein